MHPQTEQEYKKQLKHVITLYLQDPQTAIKMFPFFIKEMSMVNDGHASNPYHGDKRSLSSGSYVDALIWNDVKKLKRELERSVIKMSPVLSISRTLNTIQNTISVQQPTQKKAYPSPLPL